MTGELPMSERGSHCGWCLETFANCVISANARRCWPTTRNLSKPHNLDLMDFSPYQSDAPSDTRPLSPPPRPFSPTSASHIPTSPPLSPPPRPHHGATQGFGNTRGGSSYLPINGNENASSSMPTSNMELYSTSLGLPIKVEAVLAYLVLPPAGGVVLLILEWGSDYVR